jgi:hypothetical protein
MSDVSSSTTMQKKKDPSAPSSQRTLKPGDSDPPENPGSKIGAFLTCVVLFVGGFLALVFIVGLILFWQIHQSIIQSGEGESAARSALLGCARAQQAFRSRKLGQVRWNAKTPSPERFCDNYRNLYYGVDEQGKRLELIPKGVADAFFRPTVGAPNAIGAPTVGNAPATSKPYGDYVFFEDPALASDDLGENFALIAHPAESNGWRYTVYWIDREGLMLQRDVLPQASPDEFNPSDSPLVAGKDAWAIAG